MAADDLNAYEALNEASDARWAFGGDFTDPLIGVDTSLPEGVDGDDLAAWCLMVGDDALIAAQRLCEWLTRAPELEEEVALANIALDLLGQARLLLARAGSADGSDQDEDDLAFGRRAEAFRNVQLVEVERGDFAHEVVRLVAFSAWRLALLRRLETSVDGLVAAVAAKGVKEVTYHREWAARWLVRLGDGTAESHRRAQDAVDALWPHLGELSAIHPVEARLCAAVVAADPRAAAEELDVVLTQVLDAATLMRPGPLPAAPVAPLGRDGHHLSAFTDLLDELQGTARSLPGATW